MGSRFWMGTTAGLAVALVLAFLLLPPWSPISVTTPSGPGPGTLIPAQPPPSPGPDQKTLQNPNIPNPPTAVTPTLAPTPGPRAESPNPTPPGSGPDTAYTTERPTGVPGVQSPPDVETLIRATEDPDWRLRWDAVNTLGTRQDPRGIPALVKRALHDENPHPRWRSLWALSAVDPSGREAVPLLRTGLQSPDLVVTRNAAVALAFLGQPEAVPELLRGLTDPDPFRRWEAVFSLRGVGNLQVVKALIPLLDERGEPDQGVRGEVALVLGRFGEKSAISALLKALRRDSSPEVRWRAALALSQLADASVVGEMEQALSTEQNTTVRKQLEDAVAQLRQQKK